MYIPIKNVPIKIAGYAMNSPKLQLYLFNDTIVITASILAPAFQLDSSAVGVFEDTSSSSDALATPIV